MSKDYNILTITEDGNVYLEPVSRSTLNYMVRGGEITLPLLEPVYDLTNLMEKGAGSYVFGKQLESHETIIHAFA